MMSAVDQGQSIPEIYLRTSLFTAIKKINFKVKTFNLNYILLFSGARSIIYLREYLYLILQY